MIADIIETKNKETSMGNLRGFFIKPAPGQTAILSGLRSSSTGGSAFLGGLNGNKKR